MSASVARWLPWDKARHSGVADEAEASARSTQQVPAVTTAEELKDEDLMQRIQTGDLDALGLMYERYAGLICGVCRRILRNQNDAKDIVQEIFLHVFRRAAEFDPMKGSARTWLIVIAYRRSFNWRKRERVRQQYRDQMIDRETDFAGRCHTPNLVDRIDMMAAFGTLSTDQQRCLRLYCQNFTFEEIATRHGCTPKTAENNVYRGIKSLKQILTPSMVKGESVGGPEVKAGIL